MIHTISTTNRSDNVYGQVWINGVTNQPGATPGLRAAAWLWPTGQQPGE